MLSNEDLKIVFIYGSLAHGNVSLETQKAVLCGHWIFSDMVLGKGRS